MSAEPFDLTLRGAQRAATTSPIYARDRDGHVEGVGSAIFIEHGGRAFVVTASHVLTDYINTHELHAGGRFTIRINQRFFPSQDQNQYDVGFIPLTDAQRADLTDVTFVTTDRLDLSEEAPEATYCIVGYRADDNSPEGTPSHVLAGWSVYAARSAPLDTYRQRQLSPADRLLLKFDRRRLFGADRAPVETENEPEGLSGAGVWSLTVTPESDKLVAIVESHTDSGRLIYAARLRILVESLDTFVAGGLSQTSIEDLRLTRPCVCSPSCRFEGRLTSGAGPTLERAVCADERYGVPPSPRNSSSPWSMPASSLDETCPKMRRMRRLSIDRR